MTDNDIDLVVRKVRLNDYDKLYTKLGLSDNDVEKQRANVTVNNDVHLKERKVLLFWREKNGHDATRMKIITALEEAGCKDTSDKLKTLWSSKIFS